MYLLQFLSSLAYWILCMPNRYGTLPGSRYKENCKDAKYIIGENTCGFTTHNNLFVVLPWMFNNFILCTRVDEVACLGCIAVLWLIITVLVGALASIPLIAFGKWKFMHAHAVFSPAYIRHVGPTSLQFRIPFDVGIMHIHKLWCGHSLHPSYALLSYLKFCLGRTLTRIAIIYCILVENCQELQFRRDLYHFILPYIIVHV